MIPYFDKKVKPHSIRNLPALKIHAVHNDEIYEGKWGKKLFEIFLIFFEKPLDKRNSLWYNIITVVRERITEQEWRSSSAGPEQPVHTR